jgi:hypothetical protein
MSTMIRVHEPPFEVAHVIALAIFYERPNACFKKPRKSSITGISHEYQLRIGMIEDIQHFLLVVVGICSVPQLLPKPKPFGKVRFGDWTNAQLGAGHLKTILTAMRKAGNQKDRPQ